MKDELNVIENPEKKDWSEFVYSHPCGNIYQTPEMVEVHRRAKNLEPVSLFAVRDTTNELIGVLQGVLVREMGCLLSTFSSRAVIEGGPLFLDGDLGQEAAFKLLEAFDKKLSKKSLYSEIRPYKDLNLDLIANRNAYLFEDHYSALIELNKSKKELWGQLKRDKRRGLQKAKEKYGIEIEECGEKKFINVCYDLIRRTYERVKMPLPDISLYEAYFDVLMPKGEAIFLLARCGDEYIATQVALAYKDTVFARYTGAIENYMSYNPGDLLVWHLIEWAVDKGFKTFDFGGGGTPTKNERIRYYKSRFGAEFPNYGRYKKIYSPTKMKVAELGFNLYKKFKGVI